MATTTFVLSVCQLFQFDLGGEVFESCGLPMGWNQSPYYFVKWLLQLPLYLKNPMVVAPNTQYATALQHFYYSIVAYMDDLLFVLRISPQQTWQLITLLRFIFSTFGITISMEKSILDPVLSCEFLGFLVHVDGTLVLTHKCQTKLLCLAHGVQAAVKHNHQFVSFCLLL